MENLIFISIVIAVILSSIGSYWIDKLYKMPNAPLTYPNEIEKRSRPRKLLLTILLFFCTINVISIQTPNNVYLIAESFFLTIITFTDLEQYVIFDKILLPFAIIGMVSAFHLNLSIIDRLIAAIAGGGFFLLMAQLTKGAIGGGDIKLIAVLGIWLGTENLITVATMGCIFAGLAALIMIVTKQKDCKSYFAYGPYFTLTTIFISIFSR